jgi:hypothetical protein
MEDPLPQAQAENKNPRDQSWFKKIDLMLLRKVTSEVKRHEVGAAQRSVGGAEEKIKPPKNIIQRITRKKNKKIKTPENLNKIEPLIEDKIEVTSPKDTIQARVVVGGKDALFKEPTRKEYGCSTIPGKEPIVLKGDEITEFIVETLPVRCRNRGEVIVIIGNSDNDVDWIEQQYSKFDNFVTVYNPKHEYEVQRSEEDLRKFLRSPKGCLVTRGSLFAGMESATVVLVFDDPYCSNFRSNFMRGSVEVILIDRNMRGTAAISKDSLLSKR